jgi:Zn-dependent peptidase ImmA (M78 family)
MNKHLQQLVDIARGLGTEVIFIDNISVLGRCDYQNKKIYVSKNEKLRKKIIILAHELGHWHSYLYNKKNTNISRNDREKLAYEYGWRILINLKLHTVFNITPEDWYKINMYNFTNTDPDTKVAWT